MQVAVLNQQFATYVYWPPWPRLRILSLSITLVCEFPSIISPHIIDWYLDCGMTHLTNDAIRKSLKAADLGDVRVPLLASGVASRFLSNITLFEFYNSLDLIFPKYTVSNSGTRTNWIRWNLVKSWSEFVREWITSFQKTQLIIIANSLKQSVIDDVELLKASPYISKEIKVHGYVWDMLESGTLIAV